MRTVAQAMEVMFQDLLPEESKKEGWAKHREGVRAKVRQGLEGVGLNRTRDIQSGSASRSTMIDPAHDIDLFFILDGTPQTLTPAALLDLVAKGVNAAYPGQAQVKRRSVELALNRMTYDVVPAFKQGDNFQIPDKISNRWVLTNPEKFAALTAKAERDTGAKFKRLVRMVKFWNRLQQQKSGGTKPLASFHLEAMSLSAFQPGEPKSIADGLARLFAHLAQQVTRPCPDPTKVGPEINDLSPQQKEYARKLLSEAAERAKEALATEAKGPDYLLRTHELWRGVFGRKYPEPSGAK